MNMLFAGIISFGGTHHHNVHESVDNTCGISWHSVACLSQNPEKSWRCAVGSAGVFAVEEVHK